LVEGPRKIVYLSVEAGLGMRFVVPKHG
jgi:hypothetical protein